MAKLINKREALKILASKTTVADKKKVKRALKETYENLKKRFPKNVIKPVDEKKAVRAYYNAIIKEAFKESSIELERKGTKHIRQSTLNRAIEKVKNTNYYSTEDERYAKALVQGYEEFGEGKSQLREHLGVDKLRYDYFEYLETDENGNEVVRYEDKIIFIEIVRNDDGETEDIKVSVLPLSLYGNNFRKKKNRDRFSVAGPYRRRYAKKGSVL